MNAKVDSSGSSGGNAALDAIKLIIAGVLVVGGAVCFAWYAGVWPTWQRLVVLLVGLVAGFAVAYTSSPGARFVKFMRDAQIELRRVVWPTRQETWQTTGIIGVAVLIIGLLIWVIDWVLSLIVRGMMG